MSDQLEALSNTPETNSVMPGEDPATTGVEMEAMPADAAEGSVVERLPGEEFSTSGNDAMAAFSSVEMSSTDSFDDYAMPAPDMDETGTIPGETMPGEAMSGEEGMGMTVAGFMPGEEPTIREPGKSGAEISGTFRLTLTPA